jgi:hypothetical protein
MLDLESFYNCVVCKTPPSDRYQPIQLVQDVVIVNFDCLYEREGSIRASDQLIYLCHKFGENKRFLFLTEDGALLQQSGAIEIIKNIIDCFKLNKNTCAVICREDFELENATVINYESIPYWCRVLYTHIKNIDIHQGPFTKKFACWFNRGSFFRLELARHLFENYNEDSYVSYQEQGVVLDRTIKSNFDDNIIWANKHTPIVYDQLFPNRVFDFDLIVGEKRKPYKEYFIEIVAETDILTTNWITEKTVKNLYIGKPFILMGGQGSLDKLQKFGFKSFSPWINETYDREPNIYLRLEAIKQEIDRLGRMNLTDLSKMYLEMMPIFQHNRTEYAKYINSR